jgi:hypothetical protein
MNCTDEGESWLTSTPGSGAGLGSPGLDPDSEGRGSSGLEVGLLGKLVAQRDGEDGGERDGRCGEEKVHGGTPWFGALYGAFASTGCTMGAKRKGLRGWCNLLRFCRVFGEGGLGEGLHVKFLLRFGQPGMGNQFPRVWANFFPLKRIHVEVAREFHGRRCERITSHPWR